MTYISQANETEAKALSTLRRKKIENKFYGFKGVLEKLHFHDGVM